MAEQDPTSKYDLRHQIGRGSFGSAFLVTNKQDKAEYVLKRVRLAKQTNWQRNSTLQERKLATSLRHPFIVPCVESWVVQNHTVNMIYAFCQNGDLSSYLAKIKKQEGQVEEVLMAKWLCQLLLALDYLQAQQVLHRDIKTSNLMLTAEDDVQLGDFGLATMMKEEGDESKPQDDNLVGTPHYMSPELLSCKGYGFKTDVWSLGCVFYELTAQRPTFNAFNIHGLVSKIKKNKLAPLPNTYSPEWRDVIALMLCKNPDKRPSVQQLMALPALRPAILEARARARELMPSVPLPPLLDPTPLTPLPLLGAGLGYRSSCSQDVADAESEGGSGGGSACSDQQQGGRCSDEAGGSSRLSGWGERRSAAGLTAAQAVQVSELSELWKANFARVQQQDEQLDTERPEQQSVADAHERHQQQQQQDDDDELAQPCLCALGSEQGSRGGAGTAGGGSEAGSRHADSSAGGHSTAGSSSSSGRAATPGQVAAEAAGRGTGVAVGYSPRNGLGVIDGYRRMMTPPRQGQVNQPGIKRTPSERVAAAIAAAGGSPGQATAAAAAAAAAAAKATGRVTPDLCPRPSVPARVPRSSSSTTSRQTTPAAVTPQQGPPGSAAGSNTPGAQESPAGSAAVIPRLPVSIAKRPATITPRQDSSRRYRASDCTHVVHGSGASTARPGGAEDAPPPTATAAGAGAAAAAPPRPLSAPRSSSVRRASDRGPQGSGAGSKQQRPAWGAGAGGRSGLTPSRQRPEQSPILRAAANKVSPYADTAGTGVSGAAAGLTPGAASILADAAAAAAAGKQRRAHGQLSPVPSERPSATGAECLAECGAPSEAEQQQQVPQHADRSSRSGCSSAAGSAAAEAPATHGLSRTGSRGSSSAGGRQHQQAAASEASAQGTSPPGNPPRCSAGCTPLPPLPLHKLQRSSSSSSSSKSKGSMQGPTELSPIPLASPVHGQDRNEPEARSARVNSGSFGSQQRTSAAGLAEAGAGAGAGAGDVRQPERHAAHSKRALPGASNGSSSRRVSVSASTSKRSAGGSSSSRRGNTQEPEEQQQQQREHTPRSGAGSRSAASSMTSSSSRQHQQQQEDQQAATPQPLQPEPEQQQQQQTAAAVQQRLELLEAAMMVIGGLVERKRWMELASVMRSEGLLGTAAAAAAAGGQQQRQQQQQPSASSVLKLGDIVVLGRSRSIRGKIRYIGPVAWDPSAADWVGMELDRPCGVDAHQRGLTYFECAPSCASFHRASDLSTLGA